MTQRLKRQEITIPSYSVLSDHVYRQHAATNLSCKYWLGYYKYLVPEHVQIKDSIAFSHTSGLRIAAKDDQQVAEDNRCVVVEKKEVVDDCKQVSFQMMIQWIYTHPFHSVYRPHKYSYRQNYAWNFRSTSFVTAFSTVNIAPVPKSNAEEPLWTYMLRNNTYNLQIISVDFNPDLQYVSQNMFFV